MATRVRHRSDAPPALGAAKDASRAWPDERPASDWLDVERRGALKSRADWLETEARAAKRVAKTLILLTLSDSTS